MPDNSDYVCHHVAFVDGEARIVEKLPGSTHLCVGTVGDGELVLIERPTGWKHRDRVPPETVKAAMRVAREAVERG